MCCLLHGQAGILDISDRNSINYPLMQLPMLLCRIFHPFSLLNVRVFATLFSSALFHHLVVHITPQDQQRRSGLYTTQYPSQAQHVCFNPWDHDLFH